MERTGQQHLQQQQPPGNLPQHQRAVNMEAVQLNHHLILQMYVNHYCNGQSVFVVYEQTSLSVLAMHRYLLIQCSVNMRASNLPYAGA